MARPYGVTISHGYIEGDRIRGTFYWYVSGTLTTPTTKSYSVVSPSGIVATGTPTTASTGILTVDAVTDAPGLWKIKCSSTASGEEKVQEQWFMVDAKAA